MMRRRRTSMPVLTGALFGLLVVAVLPSLGKSLATVDFVSGGIGAPPADFEFWRAGQGGVAQWTVVADASAVAGAAIEQSSTDRTENRNPVAIYKPVVAADIKVSVRTKMLQGTMQSAGVAFRLRTPDDYYLVRISALEMRIDLFRVVDGQMERIAGSDADITMNRWHTLGVVAIRDRFEVWLDDAPVFTAWDQTFIGDGRAALWTEDDNVTRFDAITIEPLPWSSRN